MSRLGKDIDMIQRIATDAREARRKGIGQWNQDNPPVVEVPITTDGVATIVGMWLTSDQEIVLIRKAPGKAYDPYSAGTLEPNVARAIANLFYTAHTSNVHDELVAALEAMRRTHGMHGPCEQHDCSSCQKAWDQAGAALTNAKNHKQT